MIVNIICEWCSEGSFSHFLPAGDGTAEILRPLDTVYECALDVGFNRDELSDIVVDWGTLFSSASESVAKGNRVLALAEPSLFLDLSKNNIERMASHYGLILAWHDALRHLDGYRFWNATTKWVYGPPDEKEFGISGVISMKSDIDIEGYALRYDILLKQFRISIPSKVHNFSGLWKGNELAYPLQSKDEAMGTMFHLAIENVRERGWFTEKLIDCMFSKCVPVYFGAPDIADFFDMEGIIVMDEKNWEEQVNALTPEDYHKRQGAIDRNYELSRAYWSATGSITRILSEHFGVSK